MKVELDKRQLQAIVRAEGCSCDDYQWGQRGNHCTIAMVRCNGRWCWLRDHDETFRKVWGLTPPPVKA